MSTAVVVDNSSDPVITPAVKFLGDVLQKGFEEASLRKYLKEKRGLGNWQINEAFRIHNARVSAMEEDKKSPRKKTNIVRETNPINEKMPDELRSEKQGLSKSKRRSSQTNLLFLAEKRSGGQRLFNKFLTAEWNYCTKLEFLKDVYYKELSEMAAKKTFLLKQEEIDAMFERIPKLHLVHSFFYNELKRGAHIGHVFIKFFRSFKGYLWYMKDCSSIVSKMSQYVLDRKLHKCLMDIRKRNPKQNDMVDMLLYPLNRIIEYNKFLEKLWEFADSREKEKDGYLAKALRKIGRVAKNVERYKYGIFNRNEMNKVQQFLGTQWNILHPRRRVIRRGTMVQQTSGWTTKKKNYIFFLFNDVLIWTTTKGELQNMIFLKNYTLWLSDSKNYSDRKFKIVSTFDKRKTILLECSSKWQRDAWFTAVKIAIKASKELNINAGSLSNSMVDTINNTSSVRTTRHSRSRSLSLFKNQILKGGRRKNSISVSSRSSFGGDNGLPGLADNGLSALDDFTYEEQCDGSYNLDAEFKELCPMEDDSESQTLDLEDEQFFERYGLKSEKKEIKCTFDKLMGFRSDIFDHNSDESLTNQALKNATKEIASEEKKYRAAVSTGGVGDDTNGKREVSRDCNTSNVGTPLIFDGIRQEKFEELSPSSSTSIRHNFKNTHSLIVRRSVGPRKNSSTESTMRLDRSSSFTTSLNDLYTISLSDLNTAIIV